MCSDHGFIGADLRQLKTLAKTKLFVILLTLNISVTSFMADLTSLR